MNATVQTEPAKPTPGLITAARAALEKYKYIQAQSEHDPMAMPWKTIDELELALQGADAKPRPLTVYVLAADDGNGTWADVFLTEREAYEAQAKAVLEDDAENIALAMRLYDIRDDDWHDSFLAIMDCHKDSLDTYSIDSKTLTLPEIS